MQKPTRLIKIIVFGATGRTGKLVCKRILNSGVIVTGFGRSAEKIKTIDKKIRTSQGDIFDKDKVSQAVSNHDAVIVCLGSINLKDSSTLSSGTQNIVDAMSYHKVKRLVLISAAGVNESWSQISFLPRLMFKTILRNIFKDHHTQESIVKKSSLDWTIVRPAVLNDQPASGKCRASNSGSVRKISRADLADFLVKQISDKSYIRQAISVTS